VTAAPARLELTPGVGLRIEGEPWTVSRIEPQFGRAVLRSASGDEVAFSFRWLVHHPDCTEAAAVPTAAGGRVRSLSDLTDYQRALVRLRVEHVLEAEYGYRAGDPLRALPGEPRPGYDPATTTLTQRRELKAAQLGTLGETEAAILGLEKISARTLRRWAASWRERGESGCIDGRWLRARTGRHSMTEQIREAVFAVRQESLHRSRINGRTRERLIRQYVREQFGPQVPVPGYHTLLAVWKEWFEPGGARQRYVRSAAAVDTSLARVVVHRPGQIVALDTTPLPVLVRESVFGTPVAPLLTLALDLYTHSIVAFRLTLVSETGVDVAMLLRDMMLPLPMREGWGPDMQWPYPGVPAALVAEFAGVKGVAALPFFAPETVTTDHGGPYKNHDLIEAQRVFECNILPARALRPTDKHTVERTFDGIRTLLLEALPGYRGVDVADRGADPEGDASLTLSEMEHAIATWIVRVWQNRRLGEYAPSWGPGEHHSPNTLFAASFDQGGFALQIPKPQLYYRALRRHDVKVHGRRGVTVLGLWYDGEVLDGYRLERSPRRGMHAGTVEVHSDRRDRRTVYLLDPADGESWHPLRWNGLPPEGEIPPFGDKTAEELLHRAREAGISPQSDEQLLPLLLELLGELAPVERWPGRSDANKRQRTRRAREITEAQDAARDRDAARTGGPDADDAVVLPWPAQTDRIADAVRAERRRRREQAVTARPSPPPRLGERQRARSLLAPVPDTTVDARDAHVEEQP
jgi:hypothetical protein